VFRTSTPILATRFGNTPEDCARMDIEHGVIKPWEDGMRTDGSPAQSGAETFSASTESCEVHIRRQRVRGRPAHLRGPRKAWELMYFGKGRPGLG
jgi:hypothetical protein